MRIQIPVVSFSHWTQSPLNRKRAGLWATRSTLGQGIPRLQLLSLAPAAFLYGLSSGQASWETSSSVTCHVSQTEGSVLVCCRPQTSLHCLSASPNRSSPSFCLCREIACLGVAPHRAAVSFPEWTEPPARGRVLLFQNVVCLSLMCASSKENKTKKPSDSSTACLWCKVPYRIPRRFLYAGAPRFKVTPCFSKAWTGPEG